MKIAVIGTGYVGLVSGVCFSEVGNEVLCVDIDETKVRSMKEGKSPIYEPGLDELMKKNIDRGLLDFTSDTKSAVESADVIFIAVGTPQKKNGEADLQYVENVAKDIGKYMNGYKLVVTKSTVPVGTGQRVKAIIKEYSQGEYEFDIASNPEFLREGSAISDTMNMERAVIGVESPKAASMLRELHEPFQTTIVETNVETSEMIKYAANAFLATKISFINEMANICESVGADVTKVAEGMGLDNRIGRSFLQAGLGYGGSCFPKDTNALIHISKQAGYDLRIVPAVEEVNALQRDRFINRIVEALDGDLEGKKIGVLGLAFKPNTDDMRDAPSIDIIHALKRMGANVLAYDPIAEEQAKKVIESLQVTSEVTNVFNQSHAVVVLTDWNEFKNLDLSVLGDSMKSKIIFDGRNIYDPEVMRNLGFYYISVGRPEVGKEV